MKFEKHLPTFDTPMPVDPAEAEVIVMAEEVIANCVALYGMYALDIDVVDDWAALELAGEDLATLDEGLEEFANFHQVNQEDVQVIVEERHTVDPDLTELRTSVVSAYRDAYIKRLMDKKVDPLDEEDAVTDWEDLLESDPMGVLDTAFDYAQMSVEEELKSQANPEQALLSN